jgi:tetratricopeptide (TPR) repeat protein
VKWPFAGLALVFCMALQGQEAPSHVRAGMDQLRRGNVDGAIRESKAALAEDPQYAEAHMLLGQAYLAGQSVSMIAEAKAELQQALNLDPNLLWARFYLAKIYIDLGMYEKAKDQLERGLKSRPDVPHFLSLLGEVERKMGNPSASVELNRKALARDATLTPAHYYIALADLDLKDEEAATRELESSMASPYVVPEMYVTLATLYVPRGRLSEAEALCKKAIALDPTRAEAYVALARVYNAKGSSDQAISAVKLALPEGRSFPATSYYQQLQADAYFELGRAFQAKRRNPQAIEAYSRALDLDPGREEARRQIEKLGSAGGVRLVQ